MDEKRRRKVRIALFVIWLAGALSFAYSQWRNPDREFWTVLGIGMAAIVGSMLLTMVVIWAAGGFRRPPPRPPATQS